MNKGLVAIMMLIDGSLFGLGLMLICASAAAPEKAGTRLILGAVLIMLGGGGAAWLGRAMRRASEIDPQRLADRILEWLRAQNQSETTAAEIVGALSAPQDKVAAALEILQARGEAKPEQREARRVYVFPNLKESKVERRCPYCGAQFPVKQALSQCPNCGGNLELQRT